MKVVCDNLSFDEVLCNGSYYSLISKRFTPDDNMFWIFLGVYIFLVLFAGIMSGLTIGLLSLDLTQLEILCVAGKPQEKKFANAIFPLVKKPHFLLVTLLLANSICVESMPIFMDKISNPIVAILVSVTAVLVFGEIVPQAICTRYGLAIGYYLSPLVKLLFVLLFVIVWPISKFLDCVLGTAHTMYFRRAELKVLVSMHQSIDDDNEEPLSTNEALIIKGALDLTMKTCKDALVPLDSVHMLSADTSLDYQTMSEIIDFGHSRIPVYEKNRKNIIGILLVKSIITLHPYDNVPVIDVMRSQKLIPRFPENAPLYSVLKACQTGRSHLCLVTDSNLEVVGIITLEDILEEILQEEIFDETDLCINMKNRIKVACKILSHSSSKSLTSSKNVIAPYRQKKEYDDENNEHSPLINH
ncbi:uncharacterized protein LOC100201369 [Hydra vulgaris]|uniref:uncharacterized protein LOC100201369 n=1 Tax=Hydra vulgaris TaxID=6087 RepID=UPI00064129B6|nr:DUF21 domain-containing protein At4g14240 isoform X1 [Hydra vulgaris]